MNPNHETGRRRAAQRFWSERFEKEKRYTQRLSSLLQGYTGFILDTVLNSRSHALSVIGQLDNVIENCDDLIFDSQHQTDAYAMLHFADRYYRFHLTYRWLLEKGGLPVAPYKNNILELGAGPAPATFAAADIYPMFAETNSSSEEVSLSDVDYQTSYVERSCLFREQIKSFEDYLHTREPTIKRNLPDENTSINDFSNTDFLDLRLRSLDDGEEEWNTQYKFNLIVASNFITNMDSIDRWENEVESCISALRNMGVLLIVGGHTARYEKIYNRLAERFTYENRTNTRTISSFVELENLSKKMSYGSNNSDACYVSNYYRQVWERLEKLNVKNELSSNAQGFFQRRISFTTEGQQPTWSVQVFRRKTRKKPKNSISARLKPKR